MTKQNARTSCLVYHTNKKNGAGFSFKFEAAISGKEIYICDATNSTKTTKNPVFSYNAN